MTTKTDFTEEEWDELLKAPMTVGVLVITADPGMTSVLSEMKGMMDGMMKQIVPAGAQELVGNLLQEIKAKAENKEKMEPPDIKGKDPQMVAAELLDQLSGVAALLDEKCTEDEAAGFKRWLMGVAENTAEAGREGGFLGIGSVRVSDKETAILEEISQTLGLS